MKIAANRLLEGIKSRLSKPVNFPRYLIVLAVILVIALDLRLTSVIHTDMVAAIRADAREYILYAYNVKNFGVYSQADSLAESLPPPAPDAKRTPLYPLFLMPFLSKPITAENIAAITVTQAIISTVTVLVVFLLCRMFLTLPFALAAAALTALSPHLATMNIYVLSETLFCFLLVMAIYITAVAFTRAKPALSLFGGAILAAASLAHPMATYFLLPLILFLLFSRGRKTGYRHAAMLVLGFCLVFGPWIVRNLMTLGSAGDNSLTRIVLRTGAYPDLMYRGDRDSFPFPYRADPTFKDTSKDMPSVLSEIALSFRETPWEQLRWYLLGKPLMLYSWNMVEGQRIDEPGDIFTYPVINTPYRYLPHFRASRALMYVIHWALVLSMLVACIVVWLPLNRSGLSEKSAFVMRMISLLIGYHLAVMIAGVPVPRYSIPMRPFTYAMAMLPLMLAARWFFNKRSLRRLFS